MYKQVHKSFALLSCVMLKESGQMPQSFVDAHSTTGLILLQLLQMASLHSDQRKEREMACAVWVRWCARSFSTHGPL